MAFRKVMLIALFAACILVMPGTLAAQHQAYTGFAEPLQSFALSSRNMSFATSTEQKTLSVSVSDYAVYRKAYVSMDGRNWQNVTLSGKALGGDWLNGSVSGQVPLTAVNFSLTQSRLSTGRNFMVVYSCSRLANNQGWDCHGGWQILQFNASLAAAAPPQPPPWQQGMLAWWKLDGSAQDSVGSAHGTVSGAVPATSGCVSGGCYSFDGADDRITAGAVAIPGNKGTIALWVKAAAGSASGWMCAIGRYWTQHSAGKWGDGPNFVGSWETDSDELGGIESSVAVDAGWHHLVLTYDGDPASGNLKMYVDGALMGSKNLKGGTANNAAPWQMGAHGNDGEFWGGLIDEVMLFGRALTAAEVSEMHAYFTGAGCTGDSGCPADYQGAPYCSGGDAYADYHDWSCSGGKCQDSVSTTLVEDCDDGNPCTIDTCSGGQCYHQGTSCGTGTAWEVNAAMGRGVNAWGVVDDASCAMGSEWKESYFGQIKSAGFNHVRLVIDGFYEEGGYTLSQQSLSNLRGVIDKCNAAGLVAVLDYHTPAFLHDPSQYNRDRFVSHWGQLSDYFKGYSNMNLVFELVNEPSGDLSASEWNVLAASAVAAIRARDSQRVVIVSPASWASVTALEDFALPNDDKLIVSFHYYQPHTFTHQCAEWIEGYSEVCGEKWYTIQPVIDEVEEYFAPAIAFSQEHNVPVTIGEFGVYDAPADSKVRYLNYHARYFESLGWSWAVWDFFVNYGRGFNIFDKNTDSFIPEFLNALVNNPMPPVMPHSARTIYRSNFAGGTDGWYLTTSGTGSASLGVSSGELVATVSNQGSGPEAIVLHKSTPMQKGKMYRVRYTIRSSPARDWLVARIGRQYTWINHYGVDEQGESSDYAFFYAWNDDSGAEIWFQVGGYYAKFYVSEVTFEELTLA